MKNQKKKQNKINDLKNEILFGDLKESGHNYKQPYKKERIDLESEQIYSWFGNIKKTLIEILYYFIYTIALFILFSPIFLALIKHNWNFLWFLPLSFILMFLFLLIIVCFEDRFRNVES